MQTQIQIKWKYKYSHVAVIGRRASHGKMIHNDHHPHALVSHQISPETVWKNTTTKTFYWHKSGVDQLVLIYHCQVRQECPWIDLIFCTFLHTHQSFFPFYGQQPVLSPPLNLFQTMLPKWLQLAPHTAIIWLKATLFIIGCTVGLTMCQTWCNKAEMMMTIQENCIPDPPIHKWQMANQICLNLQIYFQASYMLQLISGTFFGPNSSKFV